ncbi:TPA: hypothetical protein QH074_004319 [Enterobacter hormaechei subsp. steigerwaltii]|nr:hypothetical protein [Enterobacter hormaechei subsp. steigerwaltii]
MSAPIDFWIALLKDLYPVVAAFSPVAAKMLTRWLIKRRKLKEGARKGG